MAGQHWTEPAGNAFANDYFPASAAQPTIEGFLAASVTSAGVLNLRTTFAVNEAGQVIGVTDPLNHAAQFALDPCTLLRKVTLPIPGYTIEYHHDGNGQVTSRAIAIIEPDGSAAPGSPEIATFLYSEEMSVVLAAVGDSSPVPPRRTQRVYDSSNRLVRIVNPRGNWTCFEYDERSLVRRITRGCCTAAAAATRSATTSTSCALPRPTRAVTPVRRGSTPSAGQSKPPMLTATGNGPTTTNRIMRSYSGSSAAYRMARTRYCGGRSTCTTSAAS